MIDLWLGWLLVAQIAMGAFDTLYHHELTQRLAWRPSQAAELRLHGVRNFIYAIVFLALAWTVPQGGWAILLIVLLAIEVVITLWDFVEEDRSRLLPATERVTHTLLALNYGLILALLMPILWQAASRPAALPPAWNGFFSIAFTLAAIGVAIAGLRDLVAAGRSVRIAERDAAPLAAALSGRRSILVTGGTGLVGTRLIAALTGAGHDVTVLTRDPAHARHLPAPLRIVTDLGQIANSDRIDAIVNLAGEGIASGLWTRRRREAILASRIDTTRALHALCKRLSKRPKVLISASAIGYYGNGGDTVLDEGGEQGDGFCAGICAAWEAEAVRHAELGLRVVRLRIGLVLASAGGFLANLLLPFEAGLGGRIGNGRQWLSWIHRDDLVRLIAFAIEERELEGVVNAAAPNPVRNAAFAAALGAALRRPAFMPLPAAPLRLALGDFAEELFLASQRVLPVKAVFHGFRFDHPRIEGALACIVGAPPPAERQPRHRGLADARLLH